MDDLLYAFKRGNTNLPRCCQLNFTLPTDKSNAIRSQTLNMGPIKQKALINVDLGEGYGNLKCGPDAELLPLIDIANVACGFQYVSSKPKSQATPHKQSSSHSLPEHSLYRAGLSLKDPILT